MLQRIQTIYLLIVLVLGAINAFFPIMEFVNDTNVYQLTISGLQQITEDNQPKTVEIAWSLSAMLVIIPLITLISINLFKRRMLQLRLTIFNTLIMFGYYALYFYFLYYFKEKYECISDMQWTVIIPAISIILNYLAIRGIGKDEALVRSLDRIR